MEKKPVTEIWPIPVNDTVLLGLLVAVWVGFVAGAFMEKWSR